MSANNRLIFDNLPGGHRAEIIPVCNMKVESAYYLEVYHGNKLIQGTEMIFDEVEHALYFAEGYIFAKEEKPQE